MSSACVAAHVQVIAKLRRTRRAAFCIDAPSDLSTACEAGDLQVVEQGHETKIHMQLLVAVE